MAGFLSKLKIAIHISAALTWELRAHFFSDSNAKYMESEIEVSSPFFVCNVLNEWEEALSLKEDIAFASLLI